MKWGLMTALATALLALSMAAAAQERLLIEDVTLIDGKGRAPQTGRWILIEDGRIAAVTGQAPETIDEGVERIDARGKYLLPGLMDVHIHLRGGAAVTPEGLRQPDLDFDEGISALHSYLYSGVVTLYDSGNNPDFILELRRRERAGEIVAPRIFATGGIVTYPGSHGSGPGATLVADWPEAKPKLDAHIARSPDMVKLTLEERGWGARPLIPLLPIDLMQRIVEYYNERGIRATVHTAGEYRARQAIYAGVDALSHPIITGPVTEAFAKLMGAKKTPMATTLTIGENYSRLADHPEYLDQPLYRAVLSETEIARLKTEVRAEYQARRWTRWMELMTPVAQENLRMIHAAGGVLALGTDQTIGPAVHREMELLVAAGIAPLDVITIATLNGARFLGMADRLGSVETGKIADLLIVDADPTEDIGNAKRISHVIKGGKILDRAGLSLPIRFAADN